MFTLIAIGYLFFKKNMITIQGSADMGKVLLYLVIPVVIVNSFWIERTQEKTMELLYSILLSIVAMGLSVLIGYLFFGKKDGISAFSSAFSNAGFIGIPLVTAAVGNEGAFFTMDSRCLHDFQRQKRHEFQKDTDQSYCHFCCHWLICILSEYSTTSYHH